MRVHSLLLLGIVAGLVSGQNLERETCDAKRSEVNVQMTNANVVLGGLFELRTPLLESYACGEPHQEMVQMFEATRWALGKVNALLNPKGLRLGMKVYDTCFNQFLAINAVNKFYPQFSTSKSSCTLGNQGKLGILGPFSSWTTKPVAAVTAPYKIPVVSPRAMSNELSDKSLYPYLLRTVPSIFGQVRAMLETMKQLKWNRIVIVHTDSVYGRNGYKILQQQAYKHGITCITAGIELPADGDQKQYEQILKVLNSYDTKVGVFFGSYVNALKLFSTLELLQNGGSVQWMFSDLSLVNNVYSSAIVRGALYVAPKNTMVTEFRDYFVDLNPEAPPAENPWFTDWYMTYHKCRFAGVAYAPYSAYPVCPTKTRAQKLTEFVQIPYTVTTVKSVFAYAKALLTAQTVQCGALSTTLCNNLKQLSSEDFFNYVKDVNFQFGASEGVPSLNGQRVQFDANGDAVQQDFSVYNFNNRNGGFAFEEVGSYDGGVLNLDTNKIRMYDVNRQVPLGSLQTSTCPPMGCNYCDIPRDMVEFLYTPGDVIISGITSAHYPGTEPLSCGPANAMGLASSVAFQYAINTAKTQMAGVLNGVKLGGLIADICGQGQVGRLLFNNMLAGFHVVRDSKGRMVDVPAIKAFVEGTGSATTKEFSQGISTFGLPEVASVASSMELGMKDKFPNLVRAIPADDKMVAAMNQFLVTMQWKYIQTIQSPDSYGQDSMKNLREHTSISQICISASYEVGTDGSYTDIVKKVMQKPDASVVVVFLSNGPGELLQAIKQMNAQRKFVILASDSWGSFNTAVKGLETEADGSITIEPQISDISGFVTWINTLNPRNSGSVPGFTELYQIVHECYVDATAKGDYTKECGTSRITDGVNYQNIFPISYMINSVFAVAKGLDQTLKFFCGSSYSGVCPNFRSSTDVSKKLLEYISNVSFKTADSPNEAFQILNGEGNTGYNIFNYRKNGGYVKIGSYDISKASLSIQRNNIVFPPGIVAASFKSECPGNCMECSYLGMTKVYVNIPGDVQLGGIFAVHDALSSACTTMRLQNGVQFTTAMMYAVNQVNTKQAPVSLNGVSLGALILDHCDVFGRSYDLVSSLYSGTLPQSIGSDTKVEPGKVMGWVTDNTAANMYLQDLAKGFKLPLISSYSSSESLSNLENFPTYFRTIQGDATLSVAIAKVMKLLGKGFITFVYSNDDYGHSGRTTFETVAQQQGVCVHQQFMVGGTVTAAQVIQNIVVSTSQVVILWTNGHDSNEMYKARKANAAAKDLVFVFPMPVMSLAKAYGADGAKTFTLNVKTKNVDGYLNYMKSLSTKSFEMNPYLYEYYMTLFSCDLPGFQIFNKACTGTPFTSSPLFAQDDFVVPTIDAVYAFAGALDSTLKEKCGATYEGLCPQFYSDSNILNNIMQKMEGTSFVDPVGHTFEFLDREGNIGLDLMYYDGIVVKKVGNYAGASLQITDLTLSAKLQTTVSACPEPCPVCAVTAIDFTYKPGDVLLGGIFDVHKKDLAPFSCGDLMTWHGFQLLEAFNYAIDKVNDKSGMFANILKNVKLGGVGLDSCQSAIRTGYLVSNLHNGYTKLKRNSDLVNPDDINAYIAAYSSDSSIYLARILKSLKVPQISYASTSTALLDQDRYPYFIRSVPVDDNQVLGMIKFLNKYNIKYVQVVHTKNNYGELGASSFLNLAKKNKLCVASVVSFPDNGTVSKESANDVITDLLKKPLANTVIVFADVSYINQMLQAIARNPFAIGKLKFLGSEAWGSSREAIMGAENLAEGSVTMTLDSTDLPDFDTYLSGKSPGNYPENSWFPEYYEEMVNCYLTVPNGKHTKQCTSMSENIVAQTNYIQDPGILHVINAVYAAAYGIHYTLQEVCGQNYTTVCEKYRNDQTREDRLMKNILRARFKDPSDKDFEFTNRREGRKGYQVFSLNKKMTLNNIGYVYEKIGTFSSNKVLDIEDSYKPTWDGSCARPGSCSECPSVRNTFTRYMAQKADSDTAATIIAVLDVHKTGTDAYRCGSMSMMNLYMGMAFFFTLDKLTPKPYQVRGMLLDTCSNSLRVDQDLYSLLSTGKLCNSEFAASGVVDRSTVAGFVTLTSSVSTAVNRVTKPLKIPTVSGGATSDLLSDTENFPYFARTLPPNEMIMKAIAEVLKKNDWTLVSVLYTRESYGINGLAQVQKVVTTNGGCVGLAVGVNYPATEAEAKAAIQQLMADDNSRVVILITANSPRMYLQAAKSLGVLNKFIWIGTDSWANDNSVIAGMENDLCGALSISFRTSIIDDFRSYMKELTYANRKNMPKQWFEEFYQTIHKCKLSDADVPMTSYTAECSKSLAITNDQLNNYAHIIPMVAATYSIVSGLNTISTGACTLKSSFKDCVSESSRWDTMFSDILKTEWQIQNKVTLIPNQNFFLKFNNERYWDMGIVVYSLLKNQNQKCDYAQVGRYTKTSFSFDNYDSNKPDDFMSKCPAGQTCGCAINSPSADRIFANDTVTNPPEPRNFFFYRENKDEYGNNVYKQIYTWPIWAIVVAVLSCAGLLVTIFLFFYFLVAYPVRGGTTVLGFMMMLGIMGIYAINFAFFLPASEATCGARRFVMGVVYAIVFAALLVKSMDNWRYSDMEYSVRKYKGLTSACSLFMVALGIVCVELIIPIQWLILKHPSASLFLDNKVLHDWSWCDPHDMYDQDLVMSMIFVMFLVILTGIFSAMAWDSDSNYYESRWIFVGSVSTAGCFLIWMIVTTNAGPPYRDPSVALGNFVNATALLIFIPIRKLILLVYLQNHEEDEKLQQMAEERQDVYSTVYSNAGYEGNDMFQPVESKHSGSEVGFDSQNL